MREAFVGFLIPWGCLKGNEVIPIKKMVATQGHRKPYAQALGNTCGIPLSQLPTPCIKGDMVAIRVEEEDYLAGLEVCKTHLHGRIILCKGNKPLTHLALTKKLHLVWNVIGPWKEIPPWLMQCLKITQHYSLHDYGFILSRYTTKTTAITSFFISKELN